jgi:lysophospholipid acyltransferase (LPLAT)-like uncharacterized protein
MRMSETEESYQLSLKLKFIAWLLYVLVTAIRVTLRFRFVDLTNKDLAEASHPSKSFALGVWHEHCFYSICGLKGQRYAPLASLSKDGEFVSYVLKRFGYETVRGSSSRGGVKARNDLIDAVHRGVKPAFTVDGPRGPRRTAKGGIIDVARKTGVAAIPMGCASSSHWVFPKTWDKFQLPKPFSTVVLVYGKPIFVPSDAQGDAFEKLRVEFEHGLNAAEVIAMQALQPAKQSSPGPSRQGRDGDPRPAAHPASRV